MKKVTFLLVIATFITVSAMATNSKIVITNKEKKHSNEQVKKSITVQYAYVWGFDGDCIQLYRLDDNGYIDNNGMAQPGYNLTEMNASNYAGTTRHCPPSGNSYC